jgi:hypothetical protein
MAMLDPNTVIGILQGKIGDLVFVRTKHGRVIVRQRPVRKSQFAAGELAGQSLLTQANVYVRRIRQEPDQYAVYQRAAGLNGKRACDLAKADFYHPPAINGVNLSAYRGNAGENIRVEAVDDFGLTTVMLTIAELDGSLVEHGATIPEPSSSKWLYQAQVSVPSGQTLILHVSAVDHAANSVTKTVDHALIPAGL